MKRRLRACGLIGGVMSAVLALMARPAHADSFTYSYMFGGGSTVSGILTGDLNATDPLNAFVENVTVSSLNFNGSGASGPIFSGHFDLGTSTFLVGAKVTFEALNNNFVFTNDQSYVDPANADPSFDPNTAFYFYLLDGTVSYNSPDSVAVWQGEPGAIIDHLDESPIGSSRWSLSPYSAPTGVPDGGATFAMLVLALGGLGLMRHKISRPTDRN